jgi:nicotinamidase-related amidase
MSIAVLALHYQNEVLHPDGKIRVGMARDAENRAAVVGAAGGSCPEARVAEVPVVSVRIAFRPDYTDLPRNAPIFRDVERLGAVAEGSWGAEFIAGLGPLPGEEVVTHNRIGAFTGTPLREVLDRFAVGRLIVAGRLARPRL